MNERIFEAIGNAAQYALEVIAGAFCIVTLTCIGVVIGMVL